MVSVRPMKRINSSWKVAPYVVVIPCMVLYFVFFYYAVIKGFIYSLTDWNGVSNNYSFIGTKNYLDALHSPILKSTFRFTGIFMVIVILLTNLVSMGLALLLNQKLRGRGFFRAVFFLPAVMSSLTISYVFQQMDFRLIRSVGAMLGIEFLEMGLLGTTTWAPIYVSIVQVWLSCAVTTVIYLAGLQSVPEELLESSRIDGANAWQTFIRIKLPLIMPSIMINLINVTKTAISSFDIIIGTTNGGPQNSTYSFAMYMYTMYTDMELGYSCAIAMIMFVLFSLIALVQIVLIRRTEVEM